MRVRVKVNVRVKVRVRVRVKAHHNLLRGYGSAIRLILPDQGATLTLNPNP